MIPPDHVSGLLIFEPILRKYGKTTPRSIDLRIESNSILSFLSELCALQQNDKSFHMREIFLYN